MPIGAGFRTACHIVEMTRKSSWWRKWKVGLRCCHYRVDVGGWGPSWPACERSDGDWLMCVIDCRWRRWPSYQPVADGNGRHGSEEERLHHRRHESVIPPPSSYLYALPHQSHHRYPYPLPPRESSNRTTARRGRLPHPVPLPPRFVRKS